MFILENQPVIGYVKNPNVLVVQANAEHWLGFIFNEDQSYGELVKFNGHFWETVSILHSYYDMQTAIKETDAIPLQELSK